MPYMNGNSNYSIKCKEILRECLHNSNIIYNFADILT